MSYMLTHIRVYGAMLAYDEAKNVLEIAGDVGFIREYENDFRSLIEDFGQLDPFELKLWYDDLRDGLTASSLYKNFESLGDFFDHYNFPQYQVASLDREKIPTVWDAKRDLQYHRLRYFADLFCCDADSRGDSLRLMPGRESAYGIYIASDGYAYRDNICEFDSDPRIEKNYEQYCRPVLERLGLEKKPTRMDIWQTW